MDPANRSLRMLSLVGAAAGALLALGLALAYSQSSLPFDDAAATCLPSDCFNEQLLQQPVMQPSATYSSLAFAAVGGYLLTTRALRKRSTTAEPAAMFALGSLGSIAFVIGLGSAIYHARFTFVGQTLDVLGMNLLAFQISLCSLVLRRRLTLRGARWGLLALGMASLALLLVLPELRRPMFAVFLAVGLGLEVVRLGGVRALLRSRLGLGLGVFVLGYTFWILDNTGVWFSTTSPLQGHSVWHVVGALAVLPLSDHEVTELARRPVPTAGMAR